MSSGFNEQAQMFVTLRKQASGAAEQAVEAAIEPVYEGSQAMVNVKTGRLKGTGKKIVYTQGRSAVGIVSYGDGSTITKWQGIGYELLVHTPGTRHYGGRPYLEEPTLAAAGGMAGLMAASLAGSLSG